MTLKIILAFLNNLRIIVMGWCAANTFYHVLVGETVAGIVWCALLLFSMVFFDVARIADALEERNKKCE